MLSVFTNLEYFLNTNEREGMTTDTENKYEEAKTRFSQIIENGQKNFYSDIDRQIREKKSSYDSYMQSAREYLWQLNDLKRKKKELGNISSPHISESEAQFDALLRHDKVEAVAITDLDDILVKTKPLDMYHPHEGTSLHLGEFEIQIPISSRSLHNFKVSNATNARENEDGDLYDHPHINAGSPCFGALESEIVDCLSGGEFNAAFELILQYLGTVNPDDDYGEHFYLWQD